MSFEGDLSTSLRSIADLSDKVFPLTAPKGTKAPYVFFQSSEGMRDRTLEGYIDSKEIAVELSVVHETYDQMKLMTQEVMSLILGFEQSTMINTNIQEITYSAPVELYEQNAQVWRCVIDFTFYL